LHISKSCFITQNLYCVSIDENPLGSSSRIYCVCLDYGTKCTVCTVDGDSLVYGTK